MTTPRQKNRPKSTQLFSVLPTFVEVDDHDESNLTPLVNYLPLPSPSTPRVSTQTEQYEGLTYKLKLVFPDTYPYKAPLITFETPCFHPNVDEHGNICLDILKEKWSSAFSVSTILQSLRSLLAGESRDRLDDGSSNTRPPARQTRVLQGPSAGV